MTDVADNVLEFTPWQSVGVFKFDDDIVNYQNELANWILNHLISMVMSITKHQMILA